MGLAAGQVDVDTPRLSLRRHALADFADSAAMWADPIVTRHIGGRPFSPEECWSRLLRYVGHWHVLGYGYWVIREKATGRFVGEVGFADFQREIDPPLGAPEAGWALAPWAHGKGLATEALAAALRWADAHFAPPAKTVCIIDPPNLASVRVAEKCGYQRVRETIYKGEPTLVFERLASR